MPKLLAPKSGHKEELDNCLRVFENELHFTDPSPLFLFLGAIAANYFRGNPVWLMLVGPPSCGKSTILMSASKLRNMHFASQVKNTAAFITWEKDSGQGGLLHRIGPRGFLVLKDFTTTLSLDKDNLRDVLSVLRECYDGRFDRPTGNAGGSSLAWSGKLCVLTGATNEIDNAMQFNQSMGERFVYYRYDNANDNDIFQQANAALGRFQLDNTDQTETLANAVKELFDSLQLTWKTDRREFTDKERSRLAQLVTVACKLRTVVRRHNFRDKEIVAPPQYEQGARLAEVLGNLYLGMELVGVNENWRWQLVKKVALDSGPLLRVEILRRIDGANALGIEADADLLANEIKISKSQVTKTIQELNICNLIYKGDNKQWHVVENVKRILGW